MRSLQKGEVIAFGLMCIIVHVMLLFLVIPNLDPHIAQYNQDRFADGYDQLAVNLVEGNGYRFYPDTAKTLMREPGYPILLAGLFITFGRSFMVVKLTNLILALMTAWLTVQIAAKVSQDVLSRNRQLFVVPPMLFLFYPGTLIAESRGGVEILFAFMISLFMLTICMAIESNRRLDYMVSGVVLGITVMVRSTPMLFPLLLFPYLLYIQRHRFSMFMISRNAAILIVSMLAVMSPWIGRNYLLTGKVVPTASVLGVSAQAGQYIGRHLPEGKPWWLLDREASRERDRLALKLGYQFKDGSEGYYQIFYNSGDEIRFSKYLVDQVVTEYRESPLLLVRCIGQNVLNFWFAGKTWATTVANAVVQLPYLVLALVGLVYCLRHVETRTAVPLALFIGYVMAVHLPILAQARYSMPLISLLSILATIGLASILGKNRNGEQNIAGQGTSDTAHPLSEASEIACTVRL